MQALHGETFQVRKSTNQLVKNEYPIEERIAVQSITANVVNYALFEAA